MELFKVEKAAMLAQGKGRSKDYIPPASISSGNDYLIALGSVYISSFLSVFLSSSALAVVSQIRQRD